jgi:hypothetical protein
LARKTQRTSKTLGVHAVVRNPLSFDSTATDRTMQSSARKLQDHYNLTSSHPAAPAAYLNQAMHASWNRAAGWLARLK